MLAGVNVVKLSELAKLGERTIKRAEAAMGAVRLTAANAHRLSEVLRELGAEILLLPSGGAAVAYVDDRWHPVSAPAFLRNEVQPGSSRAAKAPRQRRPRKPDADRF